MTVVPKRAPARIAFFDAYALPAGAGIALRDLIARIDRDRFEPIAIVPREGPLVEMLRDVNCPVEVIEPPPPLGDYGRRLIEAGPLGKLRVGLALARYSRTLCRWFRRHGVALLHCNQTRAVVQAGAAGRMARVPVVWNVRIREELPGPVIRLADACSSLIIPLTDRDFDGLRCEQHLLGKSIIIRNAVDTLRFSPARDRSAIRRRLGVGESSVVLSAGLLIPRKGFDLAIRAMQKVTRSLPRAKLLVAGGEPETASGCRAELEALISNLDLRESVMLLGHREDMADLLAACDLFVLASRREGDPAVVLEAMSSGLAVVAAEPAAAAVRNGATGLVVPEDDVDALADAMLRLLEQPEIRRRMGRAGRGIIEAEHDIDAMVRRYEAAWEGLLI